MKYEEEFSGMVNETLIRTITGTDVHTDNSLRELSNMTIEQLASIKGVGEKTAKKILAAFELGRRLLQERTKGAKLDTSLALYQHLRPMMEQREVETAYLVVMNQAFKEIKTVKISEGGLTETAVDVRLILKHALLANGTVVAIAHYHPSGNPTPSKLDDNLTFSVEKACHAMRLFFMDHIILANGTFYSYHDRGRI